MDGYVIIGTELDTKGLEQDLKEAKKELSNFQKEEERLLKEKGKIELQLSGYEEEKANIKANTDEMLKKVETETQVNNLLELENIELDKLTQKYSKQFKNIDEINAKLKQNQINQGLITNKVEETNNKLNQAKGYENVSKYLNQISNKTSNILKKVGRWVLAVFSLRTAYTLVSRASSTLAQYNKQYSTDLQYLNYVLAQAIAPVLQFLVNLAFKLLTYINYISQAWFGINLFANASSKSFEKANKSLGSSAKKAKELKNQLAGFDEMNVLQDSSSSTNNTGATASLPSMDLSGFEDIQIPSWLQWIADNKDTVLGFFIGLGLAIAGIKIAGLLQNLGLISSSISNLQLLIKGLGIGILLSGIVTTISSIISCLKDPSWANFGNIISGIGITLTGLGIAIVSIPVAIAGAIAIIIGLIVSNWETIKSKMEDIISWIDLNMKEIQKKFGIVGVAIATIFQSAIKIVMTLFDDLFKGVKTIVYGIIKIFKGDFKGGITSVFNGLKTILLAPINALISGVNNLIRGLNKIKFDVPDWVPSIGGKTLGFNIPQIPKLAVGGIVNMPSRGIPVGGAIAGESGAEGVIPLTDSQAMETLGQAIGKYITINANITNTMNGRVISRVLQKVNNNNDFAYNT